MDIFLLACFILYTLCAYVYMYVYNFFLPSFALSSYKRIVVGSELYYLVFRFLSRKICFPGGSVVKNPPANAGDVGLIPGQEESPGKGIGSPLQYSFLGNTMDIEAWWATVHGISKGSDVTATKQQQRRKCG